MFKKNKLLSVVLMSIFGMNGINNFSNANETNFRKQIMNTEQSKQVQVKFDSDKVVRIGINSLKLVLGLAGVGLPIAGITYEIKSNLTELEKKALKQAIKNYEIACPTIKKLYDELNGALMLKKNTLNYNESDPRFDGIRSKVNTALNNWKNQTGVPDVEKLATIYYDGKNLDLMQAHQLLENLKQESSDFINKSKNIGIANGIHRIIESIVR